MSLSSTQPRAAGKGGRDKATKLSQNVKQNTADHVQHKAIDNAKPQATAEQIRIAQLISDVKHTDADPELQAKVSQVMELTGKTSDEVIVALHDCDNDTTKAINMLLEGAQDQGEWELSGKKKKSRQNVGVTKPSNNIENVKNGNSSNVNNKENRNNKHDRNHDNIKDRENSRNRGPPRLNRGKGWRGRENEKNEKNLEDGSFRGGNSQRGGRFVNARGRGGGGGRGNSRSRTFENKSAARDSFPRSIETWTNSTAEQADNTGANDSTMTVGNWSDFKTTEDWSDEIDDWNENLNETKVFTPSGTTTAQTQSSNSLNNTASPESINLASLLQKPTSSNNIDSNTIINQSGQSSYLSQYQQKATETIKSVVGVGNTTNSTSASLPNSQATSGYSVGQNLSYRPGVVSGQNLNSSAQKYPSTVSQQQRLPVASSQAQLASRSKSQRTRLPPPSKIPASAVEMPDDAVGSLDVQFGGLEFGTESSGFDLTSANDSSNHYNVSVSPASSIPNHLTSAATQSLLASSTNAYNTANTDLNSGGSVLTSSSQSLSHISQNGLNQAQKLNSNTDNLLMSSQSGDNSSAYSSSRTSQPPGIEVGNMGTSKPETSALSGFGTTTASVLHQNNNLAYQSSYKNSPSLASSNGSSSYSSLPSTQKSYNQTNNSSYAQSSSISSSYSVDQQDPSVYSVSDQTSSYQPQYQTSGFIPVSSYAGSNTTYSAANSASSYGSSKISGSLSSEASSLSQNPQSSFDSSVSSTVDSLNTGSSTLSSSVSSSSSPSVSLSANSISVTALGLSSNTTAVTTSIATNSAALKTSLSSGKSMPSLPPGVPAVLGHHHQFIMSQAAGLPFYALQQPTAAAGYSFEELQLLQSRLPHLAGYYDVPFQQPTSLTTGRDGGLSNVPYSASDGKYSRGDSNSSPIPTTLSQQSSSQQHQQFISHTAAALPPGYGNYYYAVGGVMPGSFPQYSPIYPVPPATNAHGATTNTQFQKPGAYGSHTYSSGYDNLSQPQDYTKGAYGTGAQSQTKGVAGVTSGVSVGSSAGSDMSGSVYNKTHNQLGKSQFDKPGFHAGTPPPYNLASGVTAGAGHQTAGGPMGTAPSGHYATPTAPYMPMMTQHHISPAMLHSLQPDVSSASSQRTGQGSSQQKGGGSSSAKPYGNNYWGSN